MILEGLITILCSTFFNASSNNFNITSCNVTYYMSNTTQTNTVPVDIITQTYAVASSTTVQTQTQVPSQTQNPETSNKESSKVARYAPTIVAGSGIGLLSILGIIALFLKKDNDMLEEPKEPKEPNLLDEVDVKEPENILSSSERIKRNYEVI